MRYIMKCGHVANAETVDHQPACAICFCKEVDHAIASPTDGLSGRNAHCSYCGRAVQSKWTLPFFKYRPTKKYDEYYCGCGGWD